MEILRPIVLGLLLCAAAAATPAEERPPALASLHDAAEKGDVNAQLELGILYEYGYRLPEHKVPALAWYMAAANQGNAEAAARRDALANTMNVADVEKARQLAATHTPATAKP